MSLIVPSPVPEVLVPGERVLWEGQPGGTLLTPGWIGGLLFGVLFVGFSLFWEYSVITGGGGWFFVLFGAVFLLGGLRAVLWPVIGRRRRLRSTWYAVTDQRVLSVYRAGAGQPEVDGAFLRNLPGVTVRHGRNGRGTVYFAASVPRPSDEGTPQVLNFIDVADPDRVARMVAGAIRTDSATAQG